MQTLCRFVTGPNASRIILVIALALTVVCGFFAARVEQDDNVLAFLPQNNPEVKAFYEVSDRFGSLDVAIVGVASDDVFQESFLTRLKSATKKLNQTDGIDYALSLTSVEDFTADPKGGVSTDYLVHDVPDTKEGLEALRTRVLANENIVGNLVSNDSKGIVVLVFLRHGDPHAAAAKVRATVTEAFPNEPKYWGGNPFISTYIYDITQRDLHKLAPWAVVAIIVLIMASFRDIVGMLLALASTGMGIVMTLGVMGMLGMRSNIVLGSIPVILFALGSAPPVHILTRYYVHSRSHSTREAIAEAIRDKGAVVVASAATVVAGLASFMTMDIAPMRVFGLFTSLGIVLTLLNALVFVPAAIAVLQLKGQEKVESTFLARTSVRLVMFARRRGLVVVAGLGGMAAICAFGLNRVDTRMDNAAFFEQSSEPALAEAFLGAHFGGSEYVQVLVEGDMENPYVVREVQRLGDVLASLPDVASVSHLGQVLSASNEAMEGVKRLPDTPEKTKMLLSFLTGKRAISQLVTDDRKSALINVKLATTQIDRVEQVVSKIENAVKGETVQAFVLADVRGARGADVKARQNAFVLGHVLSVLRTADPGVDSKRDAIEESVRSGGSKPDLAGLTDALVRFMRSDEFTGDVPTGPLDPKKIDDDSGEGGAKPTAKDVTQTSHSASTNSGPTSSGPTSSGSTSAGPMSAGSTSAGPTSAGPMSAGSTSTGSTSAEPRPPSFPADPILAIAHAVAELPSEPSEEALRGAVAHALVRPTDDAAVKDVAESLTHPLVDLQRKEARQAAARKVVEAAAIPAAERAAVTTKVADALSDLDLPKGLLPAAAEKPEGGLSTIVTGLPILYRGLSRSVESNQIISLMSAALLVALTMTILFRSIASGLLSAIPAVFTIAVVYGGMGLARIHLDIGTSMLASLIIGAGVDYAIHFLGGWRAPKGGSVDDAARHAAEVTGPGVWTNALMVAAGFYVLTLGEARPLKHVGGLTAVAMLAAALSTFLLVPVFARRHGYIRQRDTERPDGGASAEKDPS